MKCVIAGGEEEGAFSAAVGLRTMKVAALSPGTMTYMAIMKKVETSLQDLFLLVYRGMEFFHFFMVEKVGYCGYSFLKKHDNLKILLVNVFVVRNVVILHFIVKA